METVIYAALCVAGISFTVTVTSIFSWLRELVSKAGDKFEELIFCPWCFSHYVTFILLLASDIKLIAVSSLVFVNFMFTAFAIITLSGLCHHVLLRAYEPVAKTMARRHMNK